MWRAYIVDGDKYTRYVTLAGESIPKDDKTVWRHVGRDKAYLRSMGVTDRPGKSSINPDMINPYATNSGERLKAGCDVLIAVLSHRLMVDGHERVGLLVGTLSDDPIMLFFSSQPVVRSILIMLQACGVQLRIHGSPHRRLFF